MGGTTYLLREPKARTATVAARQSRQRAAAARTRRAAHGPRSPPAPGVDSVNPRAADGAPKAATCPTASIGSTAIRTTTATAGPRERRPAGRRPASRTRTRRARRHPAHVVGRRQEPAHDGLPPVAKCARCGTPGRRRDPHAQQVREVQTDLHACIQCVHFDPSARFECSETDPGPRLAQGRRQRVRALRRPHQLGARDQLHAGAGLARRAARRNPPRARRRRSTISSSSSGARGSGLAASGYAHAAGCDCVHAAYADDLRCSLSPPLAPSP